MWEKMCNCCEIYRQLHEVLSENAILSQVIAKWCDLFENEQILTTLKEREKSLSTSTKSGNTARVNECILTKRSFTARLPRVWYHERTFKVTKSLGWLVERCKSRMVIGQWTGFLAVGIKKFITRLNKCLIVHCN